MADIEKKYVLIVDDDPDIREMLVERIQEACNFKLALVQSVDGHDAYMKMKLQKFDLVITDSKMPRTTGEGLMQLTSKLPNEFRPKRFILISGNSQPESLPSQVGRVGFLAKPINFDIFCDMVNEALTDVVASAKPVDNRPPDLSFVNAFIEATLKVLEVTTGHKPTKEGIHVRKKGEPAKGDISALITMNSEKILGSMAISFEEKCFLNIISNMMGEEYTKIDPDNQTGASELCNQIFGLAKKALNEKGHQILPAIPTVILGMGHQITHSVNGPCLAVKFNTDKGSFTIEAVVQTRG